jgi:phosphatidate cytidylyltransferase
MITKNLQKRIYTSLILILLIFLIFNFKTVLVLSLIVFGVISILEFFNITKKIFKNKLYLFITSILFIFYVFIFSFMFFYFSHSIQFKIIIFSLLLGCAASDIGGFLIGKKFKGPKLTKISPNKTISGAIGSLIFTSLVFSSSIFYFTGSFGYEILIISIITSIACQLGDLFFSLLKRKSKIKDTGNFFPGHGGVLDRLDGIFFGVPVGLITLILFIK